MKAMIATWMTALIASAVLAIPGHATAQQHREALYPYILIDLGTFGGPQGFLAGVSQTLNSRGMVAGSADTTTPDPYYPNDNPGFGQDPYVQHAFLWHKGVLSDLGALGAPGTNSSAVGEVNARGDVSGASGNGTIDPLLGFIEQTAILWKDGHIITLGGLGGNESSANGLNDRDQVVGIAANTIPDPFSMAGWGTQTRTFLWQNGQIQDLGTLGGPDSFGVGVNERGQVSGWSYTNAISNATTGIPTQDPFLWTDGHMQDLGTLGGTLGGANNFNNRGQVVGQSNLAGDQTYHPFLWNQGVLKDLGTLGGDNGFATWINEAGDVVGRADLPGSQTHHAFLWKDGVMTDLGVPAGDNCDTAYGVNAADQVVGNSGICGVGGIDAFLWAKGAIYNVNTLVMPSDLQVTQALDINNAGEIAGLGYFPNGQQHAVLLIPTRLAASEGITSNAPAPGTINPTVETPARSTPCAPVPLWRVRLARGPNAPCLGA